MKFLQVLKYTQSVKKDGVWYKEYALYSNNEFVATVVQKTEDENIHLVLWYGGDRHGKSDLTECGMDGLMDFVASKLN